MGSLAETAGMSMGNGESNPPAASQTQGNGGESAAPAALSQPQAGGENRVTETDGNPQALSSGDMTGGNLPNWTEQLSKTLREDAERASRLVRFKTLDDVVAALEEAEKKAADAGVIPEGAVMLPKDATPEQRAQFYAALGVPKDASKYSFAGEEGAAQFADVARKANLTDAQAKEIWDASKSQLGSMLNNIQVQQKNDLIATDKMLKEQYGARYDEALAYLDKGWKGCKKMLLNAGLAGKPEIVKAFIALGQTSSESVLAPGGSGAGGGEKPKSIKDGASFGYKNNEEYLEAARAKPGARA